MLNSINEPIGLLNTVSESIFPKALSRTHHSFEIVRHSVYVNGDMMLVSELEYSVPPFVKVVAQTIEALQSSSSIETNKIVTTFHYENLPPTFKIYAKCLSANGDCYLVQNEELG